MTARGVRSVGEISEVSDFPSLSASRAVARPTGPESQKRPREERGEGSLTSLTSPTSVAGVRFAVRAGTPHELVARQLGPAHVAMATTVYGRFAPTFGVRTPTASMVMMIVAVTTLSVGVIGVVRPSNAGTSTGNCRRVAATPRVGWLVTPIAGSREL